MTGALELVSISPSATFPKAAIGPSKYHENNRHANCVIKKYETQQIKYLRSKNLNWCKINQSAIHNISRVSDGF